MIYIRNLFYLVVALGVFACQNSEKEQQDTVALTPYAVSSIEDIFSDVDIVPLLFEGETYPSVANQVQVSDDYIFVGDNKKQIHVFDKDGHYVSCSSWVRGAGPGEYDMMMGFSWNPFNRSIQLLTPHKLMQYDINFNPIGEFALPTKLGEDNLIFDQIYGLSDYNNLLLPTGTSESPYCGYVFDASTGEISDRFDYSADVLVPIAMQEQCLFRTDGGKLYFVAPAFTGEVFSLLDGQLKNEITFSYDGDFISKVDVSKYDGDEAGLGRYLMECDKSIPVRTMISNDKVLTYVKSGQTLRDFYVIFTDLKNGDNRRVNLYDGVDCKFPFADYSDGDGIYVVYDKESLLNSPKLLLDKAEKKDSIFADIEDESLILLKYKF